MIILIYLFRFQRGILIKMVEEKSNSIKVIELARAVFEAIQGGFGLIRFSVTELVPTNGESGKDSKKWKLTCRFYETPSSSEPSVYEAQVNLNDDTVEIKKIGDVKQTKYNVTPS